MAIARVRVEAEMAQHTSRTLRTLAAVLVVGSVACAPRRDPYAPVVTTSAELPAAPVLGDPVPAGDARGSVRLAAAGLIPLEHSDRRAVQLRMQVQNLGNEPWTIRQAEQRLELITGEQVYPTTRNGEPLPVVEVPPRSTTTLDLFFPLPLRMQDARMMEPFDALWTIHFGAVAYRARSTFDAVPADLTQTVPAGADPFNTPQASGAPSAGVP
jgi:hypothetical protein